MKKRWLTTRELCQIGVFAAVIAALSPLSIPLPLGVSITPQTFIIPLAGVMLGAKKGTLATVVYILLGALGLPIFSNFAGGLGVVFGPTGGYIYSFPLLAFLPGFAAERKNYPLLAVCLFLGLSLNLLCGTLVYAWMTQKSFALAFAACFTPFIPASIVKGILAGVLGVRGAKLLPAKLLAA